uniref:Uncharacterized protein n=1 Tax=Brassica oleracea var. oleracea TaxID=109376 RepID=A0A0D3EBM4_BRAOL
MRVFTCWRIRISNHSTLQEQQAVDELVWQHQLGHANPLVLQQLQRSFFYLNEKKLK